jgi:hypothetical protein
LQNITLSDLECGGYDHCFEPAAGSRNIIVTQSLFDSTTSHAIYPVSADGSPQSLYPGAGLFNCSTLMWQANNTNHNPHINFVTTGNIFLYSGQAGLEAIHYNAEICGGEIGSNIIVGGGGTGIGLQTGAQDVLVDNNVIANNSSAGITLSVYGCDNNGSAATAGQIGSTCDSGYTAGTHYYPNMLNGNRIVNNTIWTGTNSPNGASPVCQTACATPSYGIYVYDYSQGTPDTRWIKNTTIANNVIVTFNRGSYPQFDFLVNSWPETNTIASNLLFNASTGNSAVYVMHIASAADCTSANHPYWVCTGAGKWNDTQNFSASPGNYSFATFQNYNTAKNGGNRWGDPQFVSANPSLYNQPHLFNFRLLSGSAAVNNASAPYAPSADITGATRSATPTIGAYEGGAGVPRASRATRTAKENIIRKGKPQ